MAFNPFVAALDAGTDSVERTSQALDRSRMAPERAEELATIEVGGTPSEVVYEENKLELLHYEAQTDEQHGVPIIIVYALINKPFILDLQPDRSVVRRLLEAGHDVYLIDWNEPSRLDQHLTLDDYINRYIDNCVDVVRERSGQEAVNVLGYCMGGTMSAIYAALHPEKVLNLGLMAAGLRFEGTGGVLEEWGSEEYYSPRDVVDTFGNVPAELLDEGFATMDPIDNYVSKYVGYYENMDDDEFAANFARMEKWLSEGIDVAGEAYVQFLEDIYQDNALFENEMIVGDQRVDLSAVDMPVLQLMGEYDHLIPPESSKPFNDVVGSEDVTTIEYPTGHIGLSVSSSSHEDVWPRAAQWFVDRMPPEAVADVDTDLVDTGADAVDIEVESPGEAAADDEAAADVETVDGVGPTFAERLRAAGVETVADLAAHDAAELAEIAETNESRAARWLDQL